MTLKLEVGKTYVTRDGRVARVSKRTSNGPFPFIGEIAGTFGAEAWREDGGYRYDPTLVGPLDLVAEKAPEQPELDAVGRILGAITADRLRDEAATKRATEHKTAPEYLAEAQATMIERGKQYDSPAGERSMGKTIAAFNTITGRDLTEAEGWLLMSVLKKVRQYQGGAHLDSCVDDVAYAALFAEARMQEEQS